jgi:hypothetical protein
MSSALASIAIAISPASVAAQSFLAAFCASASCRTMALLEPHRDLYWRTRGVVIFDRALNAEPINPPRHNP